MKTDEPFSISDRFHSLISLLVQDRYSIEVEVSEESINKINNLENSTAMRLLHPCQVD
jgi:hypothetical protein